MLQARAAALLFAALLAVAASAASAQSAPTDEEIDALRAQAGLGTRITRPDLSAVPVTVLPDDPAPALPGAERIPASGGEAIIQGPGGRRAYDAYGFAPARRVGDVLYVSGVIAFRAEGEGTDAAAFEAQTRRAFRELQRILRASGVGYEDVAMINSFHVWDSPNFEGDRHQQFAIIERVKREFITGPHPAWTAVGTTGLLVETGIFEIQLIAHVPPAAPPN